MSSWHTTLDHQLDELTLIRCSLLPGEHFTFILPPSDLALWTSLLDHSQDDTGAVSRSQLAELTDPPCPARFDIRIEGANIWFEIELPSCSKHPNPTSTTTAAFSCLTDTLISVKSKNVSRDEQEHWNTFIRERIAQMVDDDTCQFPLYDILTHLLPPLHDQTQTQTQTLNIHTHTPSTTTSESPSTRQANTNTNTNTNTDAAFGYHALLTSHHLVSTTKRRLIHQWSHDLNIIGFAKIGYPGIIYAEGPREAVQEFVGNVKGMQWLALRVRVQEPVRNRWNLDGMPRAEQWIEVSKVGEVVEQMRKRGRETLVTDLGIGASSKEPKQP